MIKGLQKAETKESSIIERATGTRRTEVLTSTRSLGFSTEVFPATIIDCSRKQFPLRKEQSIKQIMFKITDSHDKKTKSMPMIYRQANDLEPHSTAYVMRWLRSGLL